MFCGKSLGTNAAIENFQVGRRLAYDEAKGRLWVVCKKCQRWNLTPLETRWEAIEEAERSFRASRMRVATDNIALAQLKEGLQLVRIGTPPPIELATWRYGDHFGRRRRNQMLIGAAPLALLAPIYMGAFAGIVGAGVGAQLIVNGLTFAQSYRQRKRVRAVITTDDGKKHAVSDADIAEIFIRGDPRSGEWFLGLPVGEWRKTAVGAFTPNRSAKSLYPERILISGRGATGALAAILPRINAGGAGRRRVNQAVRLIDDHRSLDDLLLTATKLADTSSGLRHPESNTVAELPTPMRLALEMALHEESERRAMEGELLQLEERWREAEEIASIADSLLLPEQIVSRLEELRRDGSSG